MPYPTYREIADALLVFLYLNGGHQFQVEPVTTYEPLADHFQLSEQERKEPRPHNPNDLKWYNMVQWAKNDLVKNELVDRNAPRKTWKLTGKGIRVAQEAGFWE